MASYSSDMWSTVAVFQIAASSSVWGTPVLQLSSCKMGGKKVIKPLKISNVLGWEPLPG